MVTVYTKDELQKALESKATKIIIRGELAKRIKRKRRNRKIVAGIIAAASIAAIPFTGGASAVGASTMGLMAGTVAISTTELVILVGGGIVMTALLIGYRKIKFNADGSVEIYRD